MPPRQRKDEAAANAADVTDKKDSQAAEKAEAAAERKADKDGRAADRAADKAEKAAAKADAPEADVVTAPADEQETSAEVAGGDTTAVNELEVPAVDSEFHTERIEERVADAEGSPVPLHYQEQNGEQLPAEDQLTGTGAANGDESAVEAPEVESAGELKNSGEAPLTSTDTAVVGGAVQQQKSVGALAGAAAPGGQNKTAIAESPVSVPNGERVLTFTTPPRVAVADVAGGVPAEGETGEVDPVGPRGSQFSTVEGRTPGKAQVTNGVVAGLETVDSGIIPDATVAETDGTFMPSGAPNETYDGTVAPDGLYTGAELNNAPLTAPEARTFAGDGAAVARPAVADAGVALTVLGAGAIVDEATGEAPDVGSLFVPLYEHGTVQVCTKRLVEQTSASAGVLLLPVGAQVSTIQAEQIKARITR